MHTWQVSKLRSVFYVPCYKHCATSYIIAWETYTALFGLTSDWISTPVCGKHTQLCSDWLQTGSPPQYVGNIHNSVLTDFRLERGNLQYIWLEGSGLSITQAASANQNITIFPTKNLESVTMLASPAKALQRGQTLGDSEQSTQVNSTHPVMTRYLGCNQMRQTAFIWMLESDWMWNHYTFHQSVQQIRVETLQGKRRGSNLGLVPNPLFSAQGTLISTLMRKKEKKKTPNRFWTHVWK